MKREYGERASSSRWPSVAFVCHLSSTPLPHPQSPLALNGCAGTAAYQGNKHVPSAPDYVKALRHIMAGLPYKPAHIFLATDCAIAEQVFKEAFGGMLILRQVCYRPKWACFGPRAVQCVYVSSISNISSSLTRVWNNIVMHQSPLTLS